MIHLQNQVLQAQTDTVSMDFTWTISSCGAALCTTCILTPCHVGVKQARTLRHWPACALLTACHTSRSSFSSSVSVSPTFLLLSFSTHAPSPDVYSLTYVLPSPIYSLLSSHTTPTFKSTRQRPQVRVGKAGEGKEEESLNQQNRFTGLWNLLSVPVWVIFLREIQLIYTLCYLQLHSEVIQSYMYTHFKIISFLAALCLPGCTWAFSNCGKQGLFFVVHGFLIVVPSLVAENRLRSCSTRAWLSLGMWNLPVSGIKYTSLALAGRLSTTGPPGKFIYIFLYCFPLWFLPGDWI